jgi:hypothetical protein
MKLRFLLVAAVLGGVVSFVWGAVSHMSGVLPSLEPRTFTDSTGVVQTIKANAPENGIYFDGRGLFAAVAFRADLGEKYGSLTVPMLKQLGIEIAVAFLLAWVLLRLPVWPATGTGSLFAAVGAAAGLELLLPEANWYGFPIATQLAELADLVIGWFLVGLVIGWLRNRMLAAPARR